MSEDEKRLLGPDGKEINPKSDDYRRTLIGFRTDKDVVAQVPDTDGSDAHWKTASTPRVLGGLEVWPGERIKCEDDCD